MGSGSRIAHEAALRLGRPETGSFDRLIPRHRPREPEPAPAGNGSALRLVLIVSAGLALLTCVTLLCVRLIGSEIARAGHSDDQSIRQIVMGNDVMNVPGNMIRFRSQRRSSSLDRLDLYLLWPEMAGYREAMKDEFNRPTVNPAILFLTIEPRTMSQDMTGRIPAIYAKFMEEQETDAGFGLKRRSLSAEGGFGGEELWYEADSPYPFAARCVKPGEASATPYCLRDIHVGRDLAVTYRFHRSLIGEWMALDAAIRAQMKRMIAG